jgi:hypothetical protein
MGITCILGALLPGQFRQSPVTLASCLRSVKYGCFLLHYDQPLNSLGVNR